MRRPTTEEAVELMVLAVVGLFLLLAEWPWR